MTNGKKPPVRGPRVRHFGTVESRPPRPGRYVAFNWKGVRYRRYAGLTEKQADRKLAQAQTRLIAGDDIDAVLADVFGDEPRARMSFRRAVAPYLEYAKTRKKPSTLRGDAWRLKTLSEGTWAAKHLSAVRGVDLERWVEWRLKSGVSTATVNRDLNLGSALYRWALKLGYARENPFRKVDRLSEKGRAREIYLTAEESRALIDACKLGTREVVLTALHTGMRRGELLALRWRCIDLARREIVVEAATEKAGRGRVVPMTDELHAQLSLLRSAHPPAIDGNDSVFVLSDGTEITPKMIRSRFEGAVRRCTGIPLDKRSRVTFHCLRHTAASLMVAAGVPIFDVAKILGHSTLAVTMRYAHFAPAAGRAAIECLGSALAPSADAKPTAESQAGGVAEACERYADRSSA